MQLIGVVRICRDAVLRQVPNGDPVINLALAYNYGKKDQSGNKPGQFIDASLWGKQATALEQYLLKGKLLCVTINDVHMESYQSQGAEKWKLVGNITNLEFAGENKPTQQTPVPAQKPAQNQSRTAQSNRKPEPNFDDLEDLPF